MRTQIRFRRHRQAGFTVIELIVAAAIGAVVVGAIYPMFLLIYRVYGTWSQNSEARAVGQIAAESFQQDLREYIVAQTGPGILILQDVAAPGGADWNLAGSGSVYCVSYSVQAGPDPSMPLLVRTVTDPVSSVLSQRTVAHGVIRFASTTQADGSVQVTLTLAGIGNVVAPPPQVALSVSPRVPFAGAKVGCP